MPTRNDATFHLAVQRLAKIFPDADVRLDAIPYPGGAGFLYTFSVDLGYPEVVTASATVTREEATKRVRKPDELAMLISNRVEAAMRSLLEQTGRRER